MSYCSNSWHCDWQISLEKTPQKKFLETIQGITTEEGETCFTQLPKRKDLKLWFE